MKKQLLFYLFLFVSFISVQNIKAQTQFWSDAFETGPTSGTRTPEENGGVGGPPNTSYFRLTDGSTVSQIVSFTGKEGTSYWAGEDHNAAGTGFTTSGAQGAATNSPLNELSITWTGINISGKSGLSFRGLFAANSTNEPWDNTTACLSGVGTTNTDYIIVQYRIDAGSYVDLIRFFNKGSATNGIHKYLFEDTDGNGCGDGTQLTNAFGEFVKTISGTGTTLDIKINVYSEGASEEWAIDNFRLFETPSATTPTVTTTVATGVGAVKATLGGNVTADGGATVTERGIVWATTVNPTTANTKVTNGTGTGSFSAIISSLPAGTLVHFRAYAINSAGTSYGSDLTFTTNAALSATTSQTNVSCNGGSNGTATVTASGGVTSYSYSWAPSGGTGATASGLSIGTYTCTITDNESTQITRNFTITQPAAPVSGTTVVTNVACNGGTNGAINLTPTGGTGPYTFNWGGGITTEDRTGLAAATYSVIITDANGCTGTVSGITVTQPAAPVSGTTVVTNVACNGGTNGAINLTPTGGTGPYTFNWGGGITTEDRTGLAAATYSVIITDANGCTGTVSGITVTQPAAAVSGTTVVTNVACNGGTNGAINLTPTGGTGPYTFNWGGGITTEDRTGLAAATYSVIITDANGCTGTVSGITVTAPTAISTATGSQTNVSCNGGTNGSASVTPSGGTPGYTYSWSPSGGTAATATGLAAGSYTVTITDANGCTATRNYTITQPSAISTATGSQTNVSCNGGTNGSASVTPSGGTPGYTYSWSPSGGTAATATGLAAGSYTVTITDANGCTATRNYTITQPSAIDTATGSQTNVSCNGGTNGSASVTPSGGTPGYTYSWSPSGGTAATATGLAAGSYTVTITDANGCTATRNYTITQPSAISTATGSQTNVSCNGGTNGSASVTPSGGTPGYTYSWSPSGGTAATATDLAAGSYTVTITDANGCTATRNYTITQPSAISTATGSQTNVSCNGGTNGSASVTPSGGTPGYTYSWSPSGGTAATATGLVAGSYTVTITDANGCTATRNYTITQPSAISTATGSQTNVSCNGGTNGSASVTPSGGTPGYTYSWSPSGGTAATATGLAAGSYTVTITDANGCTATRNYTITQPTAIDTATGSQTNVSCNGGTNGSASVTPSGGTPGYTYSWSPSGGTAATATGLAAGSYTVTITDANGCTATRNYTITQPTAIDTATGSQTNVSCNGGTNGSASVTPSGGTPGYTYSWSPSGGTAATATGLAAGSYTVTITDANGCTATRNYTITQPTAIDTATGSQTNVSCNGGTNGSASVTPSGGTPGYTYSWSPSGGTAATATGLAAGSYTVTITDANGCMATRNYTITQPSAISTATGSQTNVSCNGGTNGSASVTPSGGTPGYTYSWSPSGGTAATATGLAAGSYTVTITDANGCTATRNYTITQPSAISTATGSQTNVSCNGGTNGSASVTPSGGTPGYTYSWSPSGGTAATATGLAAGSYTVTITDANGCTATRNYTITQPTAIDTATGSQTNVSCNGGTNGSASVTPSGGTPGYTYSWSPSGGTAATATGLAAGSYTVTITDANGCTATRNYTITQPSAIDTATGSQTNVSCNGGTNGSASVTPSGGTPGYTYSWSPSGGTAATATGLAAGSYTVTITDANGCTATRNYTITQPSAISTATGSQTNVSCNGGTNGSASVTPSGGTPGYTYSWSPSGGTAATATGLVAGSYTVTITDANGCTATRNYTITQPSAISTATGSQTNVSCNGGTNGSASVTPSGGTPGYTYSWSPSGGTAATATGLVAGSYTVTITDANGCTATRNYTITQPSAISTATGSQTNVSCNGGTNGSASVTPSGGTPGYTYSWSPSGGTAATATGLAAGSYTVTITDANGCTATRNYTITQPSAIDTATGSQTNVSCNGGTNGSASVSPSGGTPGYTYSWSPSGGTAATATGLAAGSYTVTITDANGCTATRNYTITQPTAIDTATGSQTNVSCNGGTNGSASVTPSGGTPGYTYSWSPSGGTAATATGLAAGSYTVTITDANGCMATRNYTITQPSAISTATGSQTNVSCNGGTNGSASVTPSGGTPGYTYSWSPSGGTAATATGLAAGSYTVTITDANGCTATRNYTITQPSAISTATGSQTNVSCNGGTNGSASVTPSGGTPGYTYSWSPSGGTAATATGLAAGSYTVTITDANGCTATRNYTITQPTAIDTATGSQTNVSCNGGTNGSASVTPSGGTPGYTYSWSPSGGTSATATGLAAGTYTVTVTDANGCTATRNYTITQPSAINTATGSQTNVSCNGGTNGSASVTPSGGTPGYTYSWSPSGGTAATATGLAAGSYTVTITDANGCTATQTFIITEPGAIDTATGSQTNVSCNGGTNGSASVSPSGGTPGYTYSWSPSGGTAATATGLAAGSYTVTITDANGCTATRNYTITQPSAIDTATGSQTNVSCNGGTNGSASVTPSGGTPGYTYSWSPSGGTAATATGLAAGSYTVTITDANGCTATQTFIITEPGAIDAAVSQNAGILTANQSGATYQWYLCPNTLLIGETNQSFTPTTVGDYSVEITVSGCFVLSTCQTVSVLGNASFDSNEFSYYPNPTSGILNISYSKEISEVVVINLLGQTVLTQRGNDLEMQIDLSSLPAATYFVKVISEGKTKTIKVLKGE